MKNKKSEENFTLFVAERKGFEPPVLERVQRFSRPPHSTTLASLLARSNLFVCLPPQWRRKRDSNPRNPREFNGFQDRRIRPLCHFSERCKSTTNKILSKVIFLIFYLLTILLLSTYYTKYSYKIKIISLQYAN